MSARGAMIQRATIQRDTATSTDDWGGSVAPTFTDHLISVPCRAWFQAGREVIDGDKTAVVEDRRIIFPKDTDVTEADRVTSVTNRKGIEILPGPMVIESVGLRQDHIIALVTEVS